MIFYFFFVTNMKVLQVNLFITTDGEVVVNQKIIKDANKCAFRSVLNIHRHFVTRE